jgi:hypothetical protein
MTASLSTQDLPQDAAIPAWAHPFLQAERDLADRLEDVSDELLRSVSFVPARQGGWGVLVQGVSLTSTYAPLQQAQALVAAQDLKGAKTVVVLGCGDGSVPLEVYRATRASDARVLVVEPHLGVLREALRHNDAFADCHPDRLAFFYSLHALKLFIYQCHEPRDTLLFVCPPTYARLFHNTREAILLTLQEAASMANINYQTALVRTRQWIHNLLSNSGRNTLYPSLFNLRGAFTGTPAILIAAGPSLDKNIALLREAQDRALLLCVNTSLKAALAAGLRPDLVMSLEGLDVTSHFEGVDLSDLNLALSQTCHPRLYDLDAARTFTFFDGNPAHLAFAVDRFQQEHEALDVGGCIANAAFSAAVVMGCDPIILVGQDLAYTDGQVYARGTVFEQMTITTDGVNGGQIFDPDRAKQRILDASEIGGDANVFEKKRRLIGVPAWDRGGLVWTSLDFNLFRYWFQEKAGLLHAQRPITLINATEGGAFIEGFEHIPLAEAIARHLDPAPPQDCAARIKDTWARAPRLSSQVWRKGLRAALQSCARLHKESAAALDSLSLADRALERTGPEGDDFSKSMQRFTKHEAKVARLSRGNVLVNAYIHVNIYDLDLHREDEDAQQALDPTAQWAENLARSRAVLSLVHEAAGALGDRLRAALA